LAHEELPAQSAEDLDMTRVILDTDIGLDIDDHWALAMLLGCPDLDVLLVTVNTGDTEDRAELAAAMLTAAGRDDIPLGVGAPTVLPVEVPAITMPSANLRIPLSKYRGPVYDDAAAAIAAAVRGSDEPVTIIAIGPVGNIADALRLDPSIARRASLVAMAGNLRGGLFGMPRGPQPEHNVGMDPEAFQEVLDSDLEITLAPFDITALISIGGDAYRDLVAGSSPVLDLTMSAYRDWFTELAAQELDRGAIDVGVDPSVSTTALFDTLPVYLAADSTAVNLEPMRVGIVAYETLGEIDDGRYVMVATGWREKSVFDRALLNALSSA
jgi:inosine-uridine nucleoside N-ribohydrolase